MSAQKALGGEDDKSGSEDGEDDKKDSQKEKTPNDGWTEHQEPLLLQLLANELGLDVTDIVDFELNLFDIQQASLGGVHSEFIHSARLDNLASCFLAVESLIQCVEEDNFLPDDKDISLVVLYDHEEVGSSSA